VFIPQLRLENIVNEHSTPLAIALAFTEAWTRHDLTTAAGYLAEDVVFDGPLNHSTTAKAYLEGLAAFAQHVTGSLKGAIAQ
jgi:hypothetical protein